MTNKRYTVLVRAHMLNPWTEMESIRTQREAIAAAMGYYNAGNYDVAVRDNNSDELIWRAH